jgi:hypothetical protein
MNYAELNKLIDEYGLIKDSHSIRLTYKDYIIAFINSNFINKTTGKVAYCLEFSGYVDSVDYEASKKFVEERIKIVKEMIVRNKKAELENDFQ